MSSVVRVCANNKCGATFTARSADVARGWAKFCSKSCKAVKQEQRTGQFRALLNRSEVTDLAHGSLAYHAEDPSWDAHKDSF